MNRSPLAKIAYMVALFCLSGALVQAQTFTKIDNLPKLLDHVTQLVEGEDGNLLGTNSGGDAPYGVGVIVRVSLAGQITQLYRFCTQANCPDGDFPEGLYQVPGGMIYGMSAGGGASGSGTLFQVSPGGHETVLHNFCSQSNCDDGAYPYSAPVPSLKGGLLGTTSGGGANGQGILFEVSPTGELTTLYSFCAQANCTDGAEPKTSPIQTPNGVIYGTTEFGGKYASGNIYALSPQGRLVSIHSFLSAIAGFSAVPTLIQGADGNFYGITQFGGAATNYGSVFKITPQGKFTNLHNFCPLTNCANGAGPVALVQGSDGNLYGITGIGGGATPERCLKSPRKALSRRSTIFANSRIASTAGAHEAWCKTQTERSTAQRDTVARKVAALCLACPWDLPRLSKRTPALAVSEPKSAFWVTI